MSMPMFVSALTVLEDLQDWRQQLCGVGALCGSGQRFAVHPFVPFKFECYQFLSLQYNAEFLKDRYREM